MPPVATAISPCLSVVVPCFNEEATVVEIVERVLASPYTAQVVIVDDGSSDDTVALVSGIQDGRISVVVQPHNQGKGAALRRGFKLCTSPYVIVQDADLEYDPSEFGVLLAPLLNDQADVVYGSRFHTARPRRVLYYWHMVGNRFLTTLSNISTNLNLTDMETCYKALRREVLESFEIEEDRFGFEPEITAKIAQGGWRVYEVGISYSGRTYAQGKKIGWKDGARALYCVVRYSPLTARLRARVGANATRAAPVEAGVADENLAVALDSLDGASNYADWIHSLMLRYIGGRVLEVGAGHGTITERLAGNAEVTATDISQRCVDVLAKRFGDHRNVTVAHADLVESCANEAFDSVVLVNVLEHIDDDEEALRHVRQALRPGGHALVFVPAFAALYSDFDRQVGHYRRYTAASLQSVMERAGLAVVDVRYVNSVGAIAWWALAKKLRQVPTQGWSVRLYDARVIPFLRRVEERHQPPFGQSLFCAATPRD